MAGAKKYIQLVVGCGGFIPIFLNVIPADGEKAAETKR